MKSLVCFVNRSRDKAFIIAAFLSYVKQHTLKVFGYYRVVLGTIILLIV